ncbi:hypothetical protein J6590_080175 [Homalodisca vitripennis]|nr:hypothetical protein J6590_080175 [Homalodisca vitripennis]
MPSPRRVILEECNESLQTIDRGQEGADDNSCRKKICDRRLSLELRSDSNADIWSPNTRVAF